MYPNSNECSTLVDGTTVYFNFTYDTTEQQYGCLDVNGDFIPFSSGGGIDTSDATAYAKNIEAGYTAYARGEKITGTASVAHGVKRQTTMTDSRSRYYLAGTTVGDYALFAGGCYNYDAGSYYATAAVNTVSAYNSSLTISSIAGLSKSRSMLAAASVGNYALFAGGETYVYDTPGETRSNAVDAYDNLLTKITVDPLSSVTRICVAASVGEYIIVTGGTSDVYNSSMTKTTLSAGTHSYEGMCGTDIGNYALFAGFYYASLEYTYNNVYAFDSSITRTTPTYLTNTRAYCGATNTSNYAIIAGGMTKRGSSSQRTSCSDVDVYSTSLVKSTATALSSARENLGAAATDEYAAFAGGYLYPGNAYSSLVDVYNISNVRSVSDSLSIARYAPGSASINDYILFVGGAKSSDHYLDTNRTDVYITY